MLFNSIQFLLFFPIVVLIYYIVPRKIRYIWLLLASYYFYMSWNAEYAILLLISTVTTYFAGRLIKKTRTDGEDNKLRISPKTVLIAGIVINLLILFVFKYYNLARFTAEKLFSMIGVTANIPVVDLILPVGISFYTFQALGYIIDVYRGESEAETDFLKYALFVSFFPQLVAGPIERSKDLIAQLKEEHHFDYDRAREGLYLMLWGFFLKLVIADRIAIFVNTVYGDTVKYKGLYLVIATVFFGFQIYCDFSGYSIIARGAALVLGINLSENFDAPYLAYTVADFWKRWHITLTSWFRDYVYIPLGGNRKGKARKYLNIFIVFAISGLWHGASYSFIIWGILNGLYQIIGDILRPAREKLIKVMRIHKDRKAYRAMRILTTFALVDFAWIFFRADNTGHAIDVVRAMLGEYNPWIITDGSLFGCGLDSKNLTLLIICIGILLFADICKKKGYKLRNILMKQDAWFRIPFFAGTVLFIVICGIWGGTYDASAFIYFQF